MATETDLPAGPSNEPERKWAFKWASELRDDAPDERTPLERAADNAGPFGQEGEYPTEEELVAYGWPAALAKAAVDPFAYTAGIAGLGIVAFESAHFLTPEWVRLAEATLITVTEPWGPVTTRATIASRWARGLEVRVSAIIWVADGGHR